MGEKRELGSNQSAFCLHKPHSFKDEKQGFNILLTISVRETPCTVTGGQYASYWNAFLFYGFVSKRANVK